MITNNYEGINGKSVSKYTAQDSSLNTIQKNEKNSAISSEKDKSKDKNTAKKCCGNDSCGNCKCKNK